MSPLKKFLQLSASVIFISALLCCGKSSDKIANETQPDHFSTAAEMVSAIRRGQTTSVDLLNLHLERIRRYNGDINAVVALNVDAAKKRAAEADRAIAQGQDWGPLHGLPMTVKDVFEVEGMPATSGDPALKDYMPPRNAIAVQRLVDAGAIIFGKTNVPYHALDIQSYNAIYGTTNNPWDLSRTPGGSSGGSAAALAAGFTPLELGSDLGGSVRLPAHYTGVFGHKPTFGLVPRYGHIPPKPGTVPLEIMPRIPLFVVGPLARSADDLALALDVLTAPSIKSEAKVGSSLLPPRRKKFKHYRVAVWFSDTYPAAEVDAEVMRVLENTVEKLRRAGLVVDKKARPDTALSHMNYIFGQVINHMMRSLPPPAWVIESQQEIQEKWTSFFEDYDVLLAPVALTAAFPHDHAGTLMTRSLSVNNKKRPMLDNMTWTRVAIISGLPATAVPIGLSDSGLPIGIQIIGAKFEDRTTIDFAKGLSNLIGGFEAPPIYAD